MNQSAFYNLSYGVYVCTTMNGEKPTGCIANSAMQITSSPATVAVSINHDNFTHGCIEKSGCFALTILSENVNPRLIGKFGFFSGRDKDKFEGVEYTVHENVPIPNDGCAYIVCKVVNKMETSTHTVFLGEVVDADILKSETPMTYAYYHKVIKGKAPKTAPTYNEAKLPD